MLLEVCEVDLAFGGLRALSQFSLSVAEGELVGLIGPNGAGKTTAFNLISGIYAPSGGSIRFGDENLAGLRTFEITQRGISRTFQNIRLFERLSVLENVQVAAHWRRGYRVWDAMLRTRRFRSRERKVQEEAEELLATLGLYERRHEEAVSLPYGEQRRLEIARALASSPKLLLLDEPAAGMNPAEIGGLMKLIERIRREFGLTILLIEHHMHLGMAICERVAVLDFGVKIAEGAPEEIRRNPRVIEAYLGEAADAAETSDAAAQS